MKKIILMFTLLMSVLMVNAQTAIQTSNALDNISIGITGGVSTPLDFNSVFPLNTNVGLKVQKNFTPEFGVQIEGLAFLNDNHFSDIKTSVKATNVGINGILNLSNIFFGYKGTPRVFEINTVTGLGWLHEYDVKANYLTAKTGLDLAFNIGKNKAHSIVITPAIYWNLNKISNIKFNKHNAQLALNVSYIYHFKTSNGTHHFKIYDVGAMNDEINYLKGELAAKSKEVVKEIIKETPSALVVTKVSEKEIVFFAFNSANLDDSAKDVLNTIKEGTTVAITGFASPEGSAKHNLKLSQDRADVVKNYLESRGVKVESAQGMGVQGEATNRVAIVRLK